MEFFQKCTTAVGSGAFLGALAGIGISIWASVEYLQPAYRSIDGVNTAGADGLTAATWLLAIGPVASTTGACIGAMAFGALTCVANLLTCGACNGDSDNYQSRISFSV